jgi:hypothetical protein
MFENLSFFPPSASTVSGRVDAIYFFLIAVSIVFVGLISTALVVLSLRYRKRPGRTAQQIHGSVALEIVWSVIPLVIAESIAYGLEHRSGALAHAEQFGRGLDRGLADRFVGMYVNDRTLDYGEDGRAAVAELLRRGHEAGLIDRAPVVDFVED